MTNQSPDKFVLKIPQALLLRRIINAEIGGLNGRKPFVLYLLRQAEKIMREQGNIPAVVAMVRRQHRFWAAFLKKELRKYDLMRNEEQGIPRQYAFVHYEFDDLFRLFSDPIKEFAIPVDREISEEEHVGLVSLFAREIERKREIVWSKLPLSPFSFLSQSFMQLINTLISFLLYSLFGIRFRHRYHFDFRSVPLSAKDRPGMNFWSKAFGLGIILNLVMGGVLYLRIQDMAISPVVMGAVIILHIFFIPISLRSVIQLLRVMAAYRYSRRCKVGCIKTWKEVRQSFSDVWARSSVWQKKCYEFMVRDMFANQCINKQEYEGLRQRKVDQLLVNDTACYRLRRWMNKFYHLRTIPMNGAVHWEQIRSLTFLIFSLEEKFFYSYEELQQPSVKTDLRSISILERLRRAHGDEWQNLIDHVYPQLNAREKKVFYCGNFKDIVFSPEVICAVEHWANMRIQSIYHTLESVKGLYSIYKQMARDSLTGLTEKEIEDQVKQKLQIILLHDKYPRYERSHKQKRDIDKYFAENPGLELAWPQDMIHPSKFGSFANVLSRVRGEFLFTLDSDHDVPLEEAANIPYLFRVFEENPRCDALGVRLCAFNEKYNAITQLASLSSNAWWIYDLRVKALVGGGGVFGKMLVRTKAVFEKELIQPDSVAEDMLTMTRLCFHGSEIHFSELVEIGQGEDVSFYGLRKKLGRYPAGAIESSTTKLYTEMLLSPAVPACRKFESLFMLSYYPVLFIIVLSHLLVLLCWASGIRIFDLYPMPMVLLSYLMISFIEGFYVWVHMHEKEGIIRGTKKYVATLARMMLFHSGYFYHYIEQLLKALKGYAKFNISEKNYEETRWGWTLHYQENKFTFICGSLGIMLFFVGLIMHPYHWRHYLALTPFLLSSFLWGFSLLFFIPRKTHFFCKIDIIGEILFIIIRSCWDILFYPFQWCVPDTARQQREK